MSRKIAFALLGPVAAICLLPGVSLARGYGPGTLIETRPFETDDHITSTIREMIAKDKNLKGQHINVSTSHAIVTLTGSVDNQPKANEIAAMITRLPEVDKVRNLLKIGRR